MNDDQVMTLYRCMNERFDVLEHKIDAKAEASAVDLILQTLDDFWAKIETGELERLAQNAQLDRHETRLAALEN